MTRESSIRLELATVISYFVGVAVSLHGVIRDDIVLVCTGAALLAVAAICGFLLAFSD